MHQMKIVLLALPFLAACGDEPLHAVRSTPASPNPAPLVAIPPTMDCVSDASLNAGEQFQSVTRMHVDVTGSEAQVSWHRAPQFLSHDTTWHGEGDSISQVDTARVSLAGEVRLTGSRGLAVTLQREGVFLRGTLSSGAGDEGLLCWNMQEVFGSPWTGDLGALTARFDWTLGRCVDAAGTEALNALPIEFVRETASAECADLRGVALNDADFANPDLVGWSLFGAQLDNATLFFARLTQAALYGAQLSGLRMGYAVVEGFTDPGTELPNVVCEASESPWAGSTVTCTN